jgi:hypothetical protein
MSHLKSRFAVVDVLTGAFRGEGMRRGIVAVAFLCFSAMQAGQAQEFKLGNRSVQVHGFFSQGFIYTDHNNWLTMNTSQGSGAMTDMGLNMSSQLTDKFRVGAQVYDRNLGKLGQWHPSLDWAVADYRFTNWFGLRAGKVKTTLGLYNDSQDLDFMRVFALLPQSVYSTDLRDTTIAHAGGDVYGTISLPRKLGDLSYTVYAGHRSDSLYSGYPYLVFQWDTYLSRMGGLQYGADLRWNTPLHGLLVGISRLDQDISAEGRYITPFVPGVGFAHYFESSKADWTNQFFAQYRAGKFQFDSEYRRYVRDQIILNNTSEDITDVRGWYIAGTYRVCKRFRLGSYYSRYTVTDVYGGELELLAPDQINTDLPENHTYDKVVTARVDFNRFWNLKIEGHFMDGYSNSGYPAGFYPKNNPQGFARNTNALVLKTGFNF